MCMKLYVESGLKIKLFCIRNPFTNIKFRPPSLWYILTDLYCFRTWSFKSIENRFRRFEKGLSVTRLNILKRSWRHKNKPVRMLSFYSTLRHIFYFETRKQALKMILGEKLNWFFVACKWLMWWWSALNIKNFQHRNPSGQYYHWRLDSVFHLFDGCVPVL